jgi:alpha-galactosidase
MEDGSHAVGLFNRSDTLMRVEVPWDSLGISGKQKVRDLWKQKAIGNYKDMFDADVRSHGVVLVRMFPKNNK